MQGKHGLLFGNNLIAYGVTKMPINVFDTPGFFDSDECRMDENKRQIASQIGNEIDVFAYFMKSDEVRVNSNIQKIFERLNNWTMGWGNTSLNYDRSRSQIFDFFHISIKKICQNHCLSPDYRSCLAQFSDSLSKIHQIFRRSNRKII